MGILVKTGSDANPNGRPVSEASRLRSEMRDAFCLKTYPRFNELIDKIHSLALDDGDINAFRMILDYCLGRPIAQKEEDSEAELNGKEVVMLKILFDLISPYLPSDKMNEIREKFYNLVSNASSGN